MTDVYSPPATHSIIWVLRQEVTHYASYGEVFLFLWYLFYGKGQFGYYF